MLPRSRLTLLCCLFLACRQQRLPCSRVASPFTSKRYTPPRETLQGTYIPNMLYRHMNTHITEIRERETEAKQTLHIDRDHIRLPPPRAPRSPSIKYQVSSNLPWSNRRPLTVGGIGRERTGAEIGAGAETGTDRRSTEHGAWSMRENKEEERPRRD